MKKTIIITIALFGIAAFVFADVNAQESENGLIADKNPVSSEASVLAAKFIKQVNIISKVKINTEVLKGPIFKSFADFSRPIPQEERSRTNPFAPF